MNYFTFIFALLMGIGCLWISFKMIHLFLKIKNWNRITATVISKEAFIHPKYSASRRPYGLKVEYSYTINGISYTGDKVYLVELMGGQANHMKSDAENRLHKIERTMVIFVDPEDPKQSVMYCKGIGLYLFVFFMGLLAFLIGFSFIL